MEFKFRVSPAGASAQIITEDFNWQTLDERDALFKANTREAEALAQWMVNYLTPHTVKELIYHLTRLKYS